MNKPLILVVEDDPSVRNLITTTLKTNDYRYVVAPNGSAAIMEATSHNPEIILLDLGLPDMDGRSGRLFDKALFGRRTASTTSGNAAQTRPDDVGNGNRQFCIC